MDFKVVIPARYASTRFPGKLLASLAGRPVIRHVCEKALESGASQVWVATDDERIAEVCSDLPVRVAMTMMSHMSGTDRIAEVAAREGWPSNTLLVNVQGDEPMISPAAINEVAKVLVAEPERTVATLASRIHTVEDFLSRQVVKVVMDRAGYALYFSRAPIPASRADDMPTTFECFRHIGVYAYRVGTLEKFASEPACELEKIEKLEQLRVLWLGIKIRVSALPDIHTVGIDTPADLAEVEQFMRKQSTKRID